MIAGIEKEVTNNVFVGTRPEVVVVVLCTCLKTGLATLGHEVG